jgi:CBS domain-containing protein
MSRSVICVTDDVTVAAAIALIVHHRIGALPVTDGDGRLVGVLSKTDLVREQYERTRTGDEETMSLASSPLEPGFHEESAPAAIVREVMTPIAFTLHENGTVSQAAALMAHEGIHRLPVTDQDGRVVGVLSALDILEWVAREDGYVLARRERIPTDAG